MNKIWKTTLCALALTAALLPSAQGKDSTGDDLVLVGLAYGSTALDGANLANSVGSGFRFGYLDEARTFWQVGYTPETAISVVKTQNVWYGLDPNYSATLKSYSGDISSDIAVGCWHVQIPTETEPASFEDAQTLAQTFGGFPAWIDGTDQIRLGSYTTQEDAQAMADTVGGNVVGTSSYGVSVVKTGSASILFQFDAGKDLSLTVNPGLDDSIKTVTYFRGNTYYGMFQFQRVNGGDLVVSSAVPLDDYVSCVISREMSASWPIEALKAQAVCARNYCLQTAQEASHRSSNGFDICSTTHCQVYYGMGSTSERTDQAVQETAMLKIYYQGKRANVYYFSSDGGGTEDVKNVWGSSNYPYLCGVIDPYEETISDKISYWDHTTTYTASELNAKVQPYLQRKGYNCATITDFKVTELTPTGNVKSIVFTDSNGKEWPFTQARASDFRSVLGLPSIRYSVTKTGETTGGVYYTDGGNTLSSINGIYAINGDGGIKKLTGNPYVITSEGTQFLPAPTGSVTTGESVYTIRSSGWGHNVGMSQWGAYAMAQQGFTFDEIIKFYFPGVEIY